MGAVLYRPYDFLPAFSAALALTAIKLPGAQSATVENSLTHKPTPA